MKRAIHFSSVAGILSAVIFILFLFLREAEATATFDEFPIDQSRPVDFQINPDVLDTMTNREKLDQMRDWLLITVVSHSGLSAQDVNKTLYDLPPIRYGYMQPIANFEYEDARSRYVGDGKVVALIPVCSPEDRVERMAHIADEHRKNTGKEPATLEVFDYRIDIDDLSAEITRREPFNAKVLFTEKYGYVEKKINNLEDFRQFMEQIDDITFAATSDGLTLGGRKIKGRPYRGIRVEDVAAIWQSEDKISALPNPIKKKEEEFEKRWAGRTYRDLSEKTTLEAQNQREQAQLNKDVKQLQKEYGGKLAAASGFSLDSTFDFKRLKDYFDKEIAPHLRSARLSAPNAGASFGSDQISIQDVSDALSRGDADPLYDLFYRLSLKLPEYAPLLELQLSAIKAEFGFQEARYDGYLEGTETAMVLFYTDLLAKLWALDYSKAAPRRYVEDFNPMPVLSLSAVYKEEVDNFKSGRLWFGPQDKGFQALDNGELVFAHNATRVYAASATSFQPGKETEAAPDLEAFLGWWNQHYEEVARYEPQYQRLNEIMKWSLLIRWLNDNHKGGLLACLNQVSVYKKNWFPDWARQQPDLRFNRWGETCADDSGRSARSSQSRVCFFPKGYAGSKTEALPRLYSSSYKLFDTDHRLSGGVSLAKEGLFAERLALSSRSEIESLLLRSNLKYEANLTSQSIKTLEGARFSFKTISADTAELTSVARQGAKLRGAFSEMVPDLEFERTIAQKGNAFSLVTKADGAGLGSVDITKSGNGFTVGWRSLEIDEAQTIARQMSAGKIDALAILQRNPEVESFIQMPESQYLIKFQGSPRWIKVELENAKPGVTGWKSRTADLAPGAKSYRINWLKSDDMKLVLSRDQVLVVREDGAGARMSLQEWSSTAAREPVEIEIEGTRIAGLKDPATGEVHFACNDLPAGVLSNPDKLRRAFSGIQSRESQIAQALRGGDYKEVVGNILKSPIETAGIIGKEFGEGVKAANQLLADKNFVQALEEFKRLMVVYGPQPELKLGKALAQIGERSPRVARTISEAIQSGARPGRGEFLDEINFRLGQSGLARDGDSISILSNGKKVSLEYRLSQFPSGESVSPRSIPDGDYILFVEDSPGLNNLNWDVNVTGTIEEAVSLNLGDIKLLPASDLAELRPTMLFAPQRTTNATKGLTDPIRFRPHYPVPLIPASGNQDDDDKKNSRHGVPVYVLLAKQGGALIR